MADEIFTSAIGGAIFRCETPSFLELLVQQKKNLYQHRLSFSRC